MKILAVSKDIPNREIIEMCTRTPHYLSLTKIFIFRFLYYTIPRIYATAKQKNSPALQGYL